MKKQLLVIVICAVGVLGVARMHPAPASEDMEAIEATIGLYFKGHETGNGAYFTQAFHEDAKLFWVRDGKLNQRTSEEFASRARGSAAADEDQRKRRIVNIDISGDAAVAKVELDYPGALIYDYMSMLKIEGEWKIVNKTFHVMP